MLLTRHAQSRMQERSITAAEIRAALRYGAIEPASGERRKHVLTAAVIGRCGLPRRMFGVVVVAAARSATVITTYRRAG